MLPWASSTGHGSAGADADLIALALVAFFLWRWLSWNTSSTAGQDPRWVVPAEKKRTVAALLELPSEELSPMAESVFLSFSFFRTLLQWRMFFTDMLLLGYLSIQDCHRMLEKSHSSLRSGYIVISKLEACSYEASWMFCASNCVIASEISFSAPRTYVSKCLDYYHKMKRRRD